MWLVLANSRRANLKQAYSFFSCPGLMSCNWRATVCLRCTVWWLDTCVCCKRFTTIGLVNIFFTGQNWHSVVALVMVRIFKLYSQSNFQVCNTLSLTALLSPGIYSTFNWKSVPCDQHLPISLRPQPPPSNPLFLWVQCFSILRTDEIIQYLTFLSDLSYLEECLLYQLLFAKYI